MGDYRKRKMFPLGSIRAEGYLREQLIRNKNGMGGHLDEIEPGMIAAPFIKKEYVPRWGDGDQSGWGAEISGNYWTGLIQLAFTLQDEELIAKVTNWVNSMMTHQKEDGYLGTYYEEDARIYEDYNAWGTSCAMRGLLAFYEATGRQDVLDAVHKCMLWFCDKWSGDKKTTYGGPYIIVPMILCYHFTQDIRLVEFAEDYSDFLCEHDLFRTSYKSFLNEKFEFNSHHAAGYGNQFFLPAMLYSATGKKEYLEASVKALEKVHKYAMHPTGGVSSATEYLAPVSSNAESEYCAFTFFNTGYSYMGMITGEPQYGDYMERVFYNAAQGARKKDERAIAYFTSPNQVYATDYSSNTIDLTQVYAPCYPVSCCPVNSVVIGPEFVRNMMLGDDKGNVYINVYGPCTLETDGFKIEEKTLYPFRDTVNFTIHGEKECSVFLKIPSWCKKYVITLNNQAYPADAQNGYAQIHRLWTDGDSLTIRFEMETEVMRVDDRYAGKKHPIAIKRGVLMYSLHIPEIWAVCERGATMSNNTDEWPWYTANPQYTDADLYDAHEVMGAKRYQIGWNIALDERLKPSDITVEEVETDGYVWETPKIKMRLKGYRAPFLFSPSPQRTLEPFGDKQTVDMEKEIELVPYGCTNLRITYFPIADI